MSVKVVLVVDTISSCMIKNIIQSWRVFVFAIIGKPVCLFSLLVFVPSAIASDVDLYFQLNYSA